MQNTVIIPPREAISSAATDAVRRMIVDGRLGPGERINEVRLSENLGISRTPLREALNRLGTEGALDHRTGHGWFVRPLTALELDQIYDIRPLLDPEALRLAGLPSRARLAHLHALNTAFKAAETPEDRIDTDDAWHLALVADCPNRVMVELIENMMRRTRRYELAFMMENTHAANAGTHHDDILSALTEGDLDSACAHLKLNMQHGKAPILDWLKQHAEGA